jgi:uncharacterized protein YabN with tetrapyrrole methylase and pyrophosphatase domain
MTTFDYLYAHVGEMIRANVKHKTKDFRLGHGNFSVAVKHLADEVEEIRTAENRNHAAEEVADALGVLLHVAHLLRMTPQELLDTAMKKLELRFEQPPKPTHRLEYCDRCDGCGWYEGGPTI